MLLCRSSLSLSFRLLFCRVRPGVAVRFRSRSITTTKNDAGVSSLPPPLVFEPTCDLYDTYLDQARVPCLPWKSYGKRQEFCGRAVTVKCFEDNSRLKELTEQQCSDNGAVIVVDAGGSHRCAVLGDFLAANAAENNWAGMIVFGCVRDAAVLADIDVGIVALGTTPRKSTRRGEGQVNIPIQIGNVECHPGDYVYADQDGVLILDPSLVNAKK